MNTRLHVPFSTSLSPGRNLLQSARFQMVTARVLSKHQARQGRRHPRDSHHCTYQDSHPSLTRGLSPSSRPASAPASTPERVLVWTVAEGGVPVLTRPNLQPRGSSGLGVASLHNPDIRGSWGGLCTHCPPPGTKRASGHLQKLQENKTKHHH